MVACFSPAHFFKMIFRESSMRFSIKFGSQDAQPTLCEGKISKKPPSPSNAHVRNKVFFPRNLSGLVKICICWQQLRRSRPVKSDTLHCNTMSNFFGLPMILEAVFTRSILQRFKATWIVFSVLTAIFLTY